MPVANGDSYTVVALAGESDVYTYDQLRSALESEAAKGLGQECLATAASSAEEDSQPSWDQTILPDDEVSTNHGWSCTP